MAARFLALAALTSLALALPASAQTGSGGRPLYAVIQSAAGGRVLTQLDPATLDPVGPSASLGESQPGAFAPNGSLLALVQWDADRPTVRVLDLTAMRWRAPVPLALTTGTVLLRWLDNRRLVAFAEQPDGLRVLVVDAETGGLVHATRISGHLTDRQLVDVGRTRAAVLLGGLEKLGPARVAVVSSSGSARVVTLTAIHQGAGRGGGSIYRPALVADAGADRAYVVGAADEPVASINLRTLTVSYRRPFGPKSATKFSGGERMTVWLGQGRFAVGGWDDGAPGNESKLLGLRVVDTRSWRGRMVDPESDFVCAAGHAVVGHHVDGTLSVVGPDGKRRLGLSAGDALFPVPTVGNDRYLYLADGEQVLVADLSARRVIGNRAVQGLQELLSPAYALGAGCR